MTSFNGIELHVSKYAQHCVRKFYCQSKKSLCQSSHIYSMKSFGGGGRLTVPLDLKRNLVDQNHSCASTECAAGGAVWPMCGRTTHARKGEGPDPECSERTVSTCLPSSLHQCTCVTVCLVYGVPQHGRTRSPFRDPPPNLTWTTMHQRPVLFAG